MKPVTLCVVHVLYYSDIKRSSVDGHEPSGQGAWERLGKGSSREEQGAGMHRFLGTAVLRQPCVSGLEQPAWARGNEGAAGKGGGGQDVIRAQGRRNGCRVVLLLPRREKMEQGMQNDRE